MMKVVLNLASLACFGGGILSAFYALQALREPEVGATLIFAASTLVFFAQIIVFQYVAQRIEDPNLQESEGPIIHRSGQSSAQSDIAGTPWEKDSGHTKEN